MKTDREKLIDEIKRLKESEELEEEIKRKYESNIGLMMPIESFRNLILHFTSWQKHQTINKAYDWLNDNFYQYGEDGTDNNGTSLLYDFKKAMEE